MKVKTLSVALVAALAGGFIANNAEAADKEIAVIVKTENANFWQNVRSGAESAVKELDGYKLTFQGPASETAVDEQVNMIQNALNRGVAGIVIAPTDPNALIMPAKAAWERGIPVAVIDSRLNDDGKYSQAFLSTDNTAAGYQAGKELIKSLDGKKGKVAIMSFTAGSGSAMERDGGFIKAMEEAGYDIASHNYSNSDMTTALNQAIDVLSSTEDLVGMFCSNEPTCVGLGRAIEQRGYKGKIKAVAFDGNEDIQKFVRDGIFEGAVVQSSYGMGELGMLTVADIIAGNKTSKFVDTGTVFVTKDNIDTPEAMSVLY